MKPKRLTIRQAADELGVSERTVRDWIYLRKIPYYKLRGKAVRIDAAVIERMLTESLVPALEER